ncbi:hypothetical protein B0T26DRAFT_786986 [Lasiosphaeria miniovina]|uniref:Uncharacterized protein n=1 Tax=Lasiosphaeria miniovina TaxID=1954250 RepID=A0AA40DS67_9PEZI|nr:uncharacterized protein B0T26DRAFT_786986 [Lasiosphaeria miniovina]KAK0710013.1 hypothetical protein B0T26DRAFT_786986 [Lasiosphaeria miniovina]
MTDDLTSEIIPLAVPYLPIANISLAHNISYSPDHLGDRPRFKNNVTKDFGGPRTQVTLLTTATSAGRMLAIQPPSNISSYTINFYGPAVRCFKADAKTQSTIQFLFEKKQTSWIVRGARPTKTAYYAFAPSLTTREILPPWMVSGTRLPSTPPTRSGWSLSGTIWLPQIVSTAVSTKCVSSSMLHTT